VLRKVRLYMECGATGVMFGRNMWLRDLNSALRLTRRVHAILARCAR
jgi:class I fructose-bisphosphate aldolase